MIAKKAYLYSRSWDEKGFEMVHGTVVIDPERNMTGCFYKDGETNVEYYHEVSVDEGQLFNGLVWFEYRVIKDTLIDIFIEGLQQGIEEAEWDIKHNQMGIDGLNALREGNAE